MPRKKLSHNAPCPCGSGKKYKMCCWGKRFDWKADEDGNLCQSKPISPEVADILQAQRQKFIDKHGREPGPNDPVFFDQPYPEHVEHMMVEDMKTAGIDLAFIYAFVKMGRFVTDDNQQLLSDADLAEWDAAIAEYEVKHRKKQKQPQYPIGTVAWNGPDDKTTTKIAAGVILHEYAEPIMRRWVATDVTTNSKVQQERKDFFLQHGVKQVGGRHSSGTLGHRGYRA
jgi:hypothetical protein